MAEKDKEISDKDKKPKERILKEQEKRPGHYQSNAFPKYFDNEGGEKITRDANSKEDNINNTKDEADFDKMKGN